MANIFVVLEIAATITATSATRVCECKEGPDKYRYTVPDEETRRDDIRGLEEAVLMAGYGRAFFMFSLLVAKEPRVYHYKAEVITEKGDSVRLTYDLNMLHDGSLGEPQDVDSYVEGRAHCEIRDCCVYSFMG